MNRITISLVTACLLSFVSEHLNAYEIGKSELTGDDTRWEESCFMYSIHESGAPNIEFSALLMTVRNSFNAWESVDCSFFYFEETEPANFVQIGYNADNGNMNLLYWRTEDWAYDSSMIALTTFSFDENTGRIVDADIEFNSDNYVFSLAPKLGEVDVQNTITHEIGHMLGLEHSSDTTATMNSYAQIITDTDKRTLAQDDEDAVCYLYPKNLDPQICREPICGLAIDTDTRIDGCIEQNTDSEQNVESGDTTNSQNEGCSFAPYIHKPSRSIFSLLVL